MRDEGKCKTKKEKWKWTRNSEKTEVQKEKESGRKERMKRLSRGNVPVSIEAFDIFSQGEISECDSCGVDSDCESGTWSSALVSDDVRVFPFLSR